MGAPMRTLPDSTYVDSANWGVFPASRTRYTRVRVSDRSAALHARSLEDPEGFWGEAAEAITWRTRPERVLDRSGDPLPRWFTGGVLNTCENALDRHVAAGHGERPALIHDSPVTGTVRRFSYAELRDEVARTAGMLVALGVGRGDRVVIYMPMVPEAAIAMLACARIGAIHSVVFGGFAPHELAVRIDDARPALVLSASCGIEGARVIAYKPLLDRALELCAHPPRHVVILARPQAEAPLLAGRDLDWAEPGVRGNTRRAGARRGDRPALHPVHVGHDRPPQGRGARQRRPRGGAALEHGQHLCRARRRCLLGRLRCRLGRRPLLHRVRAAPGGVHDRHVRGQAGRHARPRGVLARDRRPRRAHALHRPDRDPRHPQGGSRGRAHRPPRPVPVRVALPRGRAARPRHLPLGEPDARRAPGDRPLVADRDRVADRRQLPRDRAPARQARLADEGGARLRRARPPGRRIGRGAGRRRRDRHSAAAPAGNADDAVGRRRALPVRLPDRVSRATTSPATAARSTPTATCS